MSVMGDSWDKEPEDWVEDLRIVDAEAKKPEGAENESVEQLSSALSLISFERLALSLTGCERFDCHRHFCDGEPCGFIATALLSLGSLVHLALSRTRDCCCGNGVRAAFTCRLREFGFCPGTVLRDPVLPCNCPWTVLMEPLALSLLNTLRARILSLRIRHPRPHLNVHQSSP